MRNLAILSVAALALAACGEEEERRGAPLADAGSSSPAVEDPALEPAIAQPATDTAVGLFTDSGPIGAADQRVSIARQIQLLEDRRREELGLPPAQRPQAAPQGATKGAAEQAQAQGAQVAARSLDDATPAGQPGGEGQAQTPLSEGMTVEGGGVAGQPQPANPSAMGETGTPEVEADIRNRAEGYVGQTAAEAALPTTEETADSGRADGAAEATARTAPAVSPSGEASQGGLLPDADGARTADTTPPSQTQSFISADGQAGADTHGRKAVDQAEAQRAATAGEAANANATRPVEMGAAADPAPGAGAAGAARPGGEPVYPYQRESWPYDSDPGPDSADAGGAAGTAQGGGAADRRALELQEAYAEGEPSAAQGEGELAQFAGESAGEAREARADPDATAEEIPRDAGTAAQGRMTASDARPGGETPAESSPEAADQGVVMAANRASESGEVGRAARSATQTPSEIATGGAPAAGQGAESGMQAGSGSHESMQAALDSLRAINARLNELEGETGDTEAAQAMRDELQTAAEALLRAAQEAGAPISIFTR